MGGSLSLRWLLASPLGDQREQEIDHLGLALALRCIERCEVAIDAGLDQEERPAHGVVAQELQ